MQPAGATLSWARAARVGPHTTLHDCQTGDGATVIHSYVVEAEVGPGATWAVRLPAAGRRRRRGGQGRHVRRGQELATSARAPRCPHLSYIGDADVGEGANIGASTITANYDGRKQAPDEDRKEREDRRPHLPGRARLTSAIGAYTGAGSVITGDVPEGALGISRADQKNVEGYADRVQKDPSEQAARHGDGAAPRAEHQRRVREAADDRPPAGRAGSWAGRIAERLGRGPDRRGPEDLRRRRGLLPLRGIGPRRRPVRGPVDRRVRRARASRSTTPSWELLLMVHAAKHASAAPHHRRDPLVRLLAPGQEVGAARAHLRPPGGRDARGRGHGPAA